MGTCCSSELKPDPRATPVFRYPRFSAPRENIHNDYLFNDTGFNKLGAGAFSDVFYGVDRESRAEVAIKRTRIHDLSAADVEGLSQEIDILNEIHHPHIVALYAFYADEHYYYLVTELLRGGELLEVLSHQDTFSEEGARHVIQQMCTALAALHHRGVAHRDLKLANVLLVDKNPYSDIKIVDFGFSKHFNNGSEMKTRLGTRDYIAPEILSGGRRRAAYGPTVDMWSLGVIAYIMLSGNPPFVGRTDSAIYSNIRRGRYQFHERDFSHVTPIAKDFIKQLLIVDASQRMTAAQALEHEWLNHDAPSSAIPGLADSLRDYFRARQKIRGTLIGIRAVAFLTRGSFAVTTENGSEPSSLDHIGVMISEEGEDDEEKGDVADNDVAAAGSSEGEGTASAPTPAPATAPTPAPAPAPAAASSSEAAASNTSGAAPDAAAAADSVPHAAGVAAAPSGVADVDTTASGSQRDAAADASPATAAPDIDSLANDSARDSGTLANDSALDSGTLADDSALDSGTLANDSALDSGTLADGAAVSSGRNETLAAAAAAMLDGDSAERGDARSERSPPAGEGDNAGDSEGSPVDEGADAPASSKSDEGEPSSAAVASQ